MNTFKTLPPGPKTNPAIQLLQWMSNTLKYMDSARQKYGDLFTVYLGSKTQPTVYVSDPQAIQQIFDGESQQFSNPGNQLFKPFLGQYSLITLIEAEHKRHRQLIMPSFHGKHLKAYAQTIDDLIEQIFEALTPGETFSAYGATREISGQIILSVVLGVNKGERISKLNQLISSLLNYAKYPFVSSLFFFPWLRKDFGRWSPWGYVRHLMRQIDELIYAEIAERRQNYDPERTDILNLMMGAKDEAGEALSDRELRDEVVTLVVAGQDGIASAMAWSLYWVHHMPEVRDKLRQEIDSLGPNQNLLDIARLSYLTAVSQEILRISPVEIQPQPRIVKSPIKLLDYDLPIGTVVVPSIYLVHQREDLYPEPQKFKPERFLERKFSYYEYLPFGGGSRRCIGAAFSMLIVKSIIAIAISRYQLELKCDRPVYPTLSGLNLVPGDDVEMAFLGKRTTNSHQSQTVLERI